jgi:hypothetical protein
MPQALVVQEEAELELNENELPPSAGLEANVDIFFFTCPLPQAGQITSSMRLALRTRSSKFFEHSLQTNGSLGIPVIVSPAVAPLTLAPRASVLGGGSPIA